MKSVLKPSLVLLLAVSFASSEISRNQTEKDCSSLKFSGELKKGQAFEKDVDSKLLFRLAPELHPANPQGWTIEIRSQADPKHDYVWVATPPYRSSNPRYLDTGYGISARQAVDWSPRTFDFVLTEQDYEKLNGAVRILLWPYTYTEEEHDEAEKLWNEMLTNRTGQGRLQIVDFRLGSAGAEDEVGWIESLKFEVELCLPKDVPSRQTEK